MTLLRLFPAFLFTLLFCLFNQVAFAQHWHWVNSPDKTSYIFGFGIAADDKGNSYVTGLFSGAATFGASTITSSEFGGAYIAKYDPMGKAVWAKKVGNPKSGAGYSVSVDSKGDIFITGLINESRTPPSYGDVFIAKYKPNGDQIWRRIISAGGPGSDIVVDGAGNCYVTGRFSGTITFGDITLTGKSHNSFVAKYDPAGQVIWAKGFRDSNVYSYRQNGIGVDAIGNVYVTGSFEDTTTIGQITLTSTGYHDVFLAKYDPSGNVVWAKQAGGNEADIASGIAIDTNGNCYIIGYSSSKILSFTPFNLTNFSDFGSSYTFITKYNTTGEVEWARQSVTADLDEGGTNSNYGVDLALDGENNIYAIGQFGGFGAFHGQVTLGNITLKGEQNHNLFIVKLDAAGEAIWAKQGGNFAGDIAIDSRGNGYITGHFEHPVTFDDFKLQSNDKKDNMFIGKFSSTLNQSPAGEYIYLPNIITPNEDGLNDTFSPYLPDTEAELKVFNRWGKQVYQQANYQNTWNGDNLPAGIYYYLLTSGTGEAWKGWVEIIR